MRHYDEGGDSCSGGKIRGYIVSGIDGASKCLKCEWLTSLWLRVGGHIAREDNRLLLRVVSCMRCGSVDCRHEPAESWGPSQNEFVLAVFRRYRDSDEKKPKPDSRGD